MYMPALWLGAVTARPVLCTPATRDSGGESMPAPFGQFSTSADHRSWSSEWHGAADMREAITDNPGRYGWPGNTPRDLLCQCGGAG